MKADEVREVSTAIFGNRYRLELLAALVKTSAGVCASDLARELDVPASSLTTLLKALERKGLVGRQSHSSDRRVHYSVRPSPIWDGLTRLVEVLDVANVGAEVVP